MNKIILFLFALASCAYNPYNNSSPERIAKFKEVSLPFSSGTSFHVHMAPYQGDNRHYSWAVNVPFGTPVHAMEGGKILSVFQPEGGGGCDRKKYMGKGHNVRVLHEDGTVAQYLHVEIKAKVDDVIQKGQVIAVTANNGIVCTPHLHFMVFKNKYELKPSGESIPLRFQGLTPGILPPDYKGVVP